MCFFRCRTFRRYCSRVSRSRQPRRSERRTERYLLNGSHLPIPVTYPTALAIAGGRRPNRRPHPTAVQSQSPTAYQPVLCGTESQRPSVPPADEAAGRNPKGAVSCRAQWVRSARKTVRWTVFSGERAVAQDDEGRRRPSKPQSIARGSVHAVAGGRRPNRRPHPPSHSRSVPKPHGAPTCPLWHGIPESAGSPGG